MVEVVKTPQGHKIIDQVIPADISDSSGDALVTYPYHALTTGDYVYIESDIEDYNGFWYVTVINPNTFKISEYEEADFVPFYQEIDIDYYQTQSHEWSSVFLPIVYKISNDRWPVNTHNTIRTITSFSNDNGYTAIVASGIILLGLKALNYVEITNANEEANGVWQVVDTDGLITIELPYDASNSLVGANIQVYYNNYQVKVKIYAGLPASHPWVEQKPFTEVGELSLTPDENNIVMFSISDYLKSKVAIKNNLTLFSLPLNLDAFTGFFISVTETFDDSDNYTITTNDAQPFVDDEFQGYAIAGKLPFKNVYSGSYSDYVYTSGSPAKWLTNHDRLLAIVGRYFDISFILNINIGSSESFIPDPLQDITGWGSILIDANSAWVVGVNPVLTLNAGHGVSYSDIFSPSAPSTYIEGATYKYRVKIEADSAGTDNVEFRMLLLTVSNTVLDFFPMTFPSVTSPTEIEDIYEFQAPATMTKFGLAAFYASAAGGTVTILEVEDMSESISANDGGFQLIIDKKIAHETQVTETVNIEGTGIGVIRVPITIESGYDEYCVHAYTPGAPEQPGSETTVGAFPDLNVFTNLGTGEDWVTGINPTVHLISTLSKFLKTDYSFIPGTNYKITVGYTKTYDSGVLPGAGFLRVTDLANSTIFQEIAVTTAGSDDIILEFVADSNSLRFHMQFSDGSSTTDITIDSLEVVTVSEAIPAVPSAELTEEICIDIQEDCEIKDGFTPDEIRLLEDGDFRLLE